MADVDLITQEVIRARLDGIVREMQVAVFRTGFSTIIRETHDFSCAILDNEGKLVGQPSGSGGHIGAYPECMKGLLQFYSYDEMEDGDSFIINSPYYSGCPHPMDVVVITPVFYQDSLVAFCASMGHKSDIGGLLPGSRTTSARDVFGEGLQILPVRLHRKQHLFKETEHFIRANSRAPHLVLGDLNAQAGALWSIGAVRLHGLMDTYGKGTVLATFEQLGRWTEQRLRKEISEWRDGVYEAETFVSDIVEPGRTIRIHVAVVKEGDQLVLDFTGTGDQSQGPINTRPPFVRGSSYQALISMIDPTLPNNFGVTRVVDCKFRPGSIIDPLFPAPVGFYSKNLRGVEGAILLAMAKAAGRPARAYAGTQSSLIIGGTGGKGRPYVQYEILNAGSGAWDGGDGWSGTAHGFSSGSRFTSVEILESEFDVQVQEFQLLPDTAGQGKFRGGNGYAREYLMTGEAKFTGGADKRIAQGVDGGGDGRGGYVIVNPGTDKEERYDTMVSNINLKTGDVVRLETPGGGGVGYPKERDRQRVIGDLEDGYITAKVAKEVYGLSDEEIAKAVGQ